MHLLLALERSGSWALGSQLSVERVFSSNATIQGQCDIKHLPYASLTKLCPPIMHKFVILCVSFTFGQKTCQEKRKKMFYPNIYCLKKKLGNSFIDRIICLNWLKTNVMAKGTQCCIRQLYKLIKWNFLIAVLRFKWLLSEKVKVSLHILEFVLCRLRDLRKAIDMTVQLFVDITSIVFIYATQWHYIKTLLPSKQTTIGATKIFVNMSANFNC